MVYDKQKVAQTIDEIKKKSFIALNKCSSINELYNEFFKIFEKVNQTLYWMHPFEISIEKTKDYIPSWYYDPNPEFQSQESIIIKHNSDFYYIFREVDNWSLDDWLIVNKQISDQLGKWDFLRHPKNVKCIEALIKSQRWKFSLTKVPKLSTSPPEDIREVISWDKTHILTGTTMENICVITRERWKKICKRETFFENNT